jgi:hypothetical protein
MYRKPLLYLIIISSVLRIIVAGLLELGNDEVYYYTYALHLQSNYFDHPPAVAFMIRLFTFNLALQHEVFIRLGPIVFAALGTILSFNIGKLVRNEKAGWYAALLYNTSIYSSIIAGLFILPDSPQIVFWLASLYIALSIAKKSADGIPVKFLWWFGFGVANGLSIMSKVHGVFIWGGFGLYALLYDRRLFLKNGFYVAILITAIIVLPILWWNYQNNFVTWNFHSNRVEGTHFEKDSFIQTFFGQLFYNNPINVALTVISIISLAKTKFITPVFHRLLLLCGLPMIAVVTVMSMFNTVFPHWSGPGFLTLSFLAAVYLEQKTSYELPPLFPRLLKFSAGFILFILVTGILVINFYPGTIGSKNSDRYGESDFTLDMYGWKKFGKNFNKWLQQEEKLNKLQPNIKIVANKWFPASHLEFYVAKPFNSYVIGKGSLNELHHFVWLNNYRPALQLNENALSIVPSNVTSDPVVFYKSSFNKITLLNTFTEYRSNVVCRYFKVYLLEGFNGHE